MSDSGLPICSRQAAKDDVLNHDAHTSMVKPKCPIGLGTQCAGPVNNSVQIGHTLHWANTSEGADSSKAVDKPYNADRHCYKR